MEHPEVKWSIVSSCCLHNRHLLSVTYFKLLLLLLLLLLLFWKPVADVPWQSAVNSFTLHKPQILNWPDVFVPNALSVLFSQSCQLPCTVKSSSSRNLSPSCTYRRPAIKPSISARCINMYLAAKPTSSRGRWLDAICKSKVRIQNMIYDAGDESWLKFLTASARKVTAAVQCATANSQMPLSGEFCISEETIPSRCNNIDDLLSIPDVDYWLQSRHVSGTFMPIIRRKDHVLLHMGYICW